MLALGAATWRKCTTEGAESPVCPQRLATFGTLPFRLAADLIRYRLDDSCAERMDINAHIRGNASPAGQAALPPK